MYRPLNVIYILLHFICIFFIEIFGFLNEWLYKLTIYNIHMWCSFMVLLFHFVKHADRSIHFMTPFCKPSGTHSHCSIVANTHCSYKFYIQHGVFNKLMQKVWWSMLSYSHCYFYGTLWKQKWPQMLKLQVSHLNYNFLFYSIGIHL